MPPDPLVHACLRTHHHRCPSNRKYLPLPTQQEKAECASCARPERCTKCTRNCDTTCISKGVQESAQEIPVVRNLETLGNCPLFCCAMSWGKSTGSPTYGRLQQAETGLTRTELVSLLSPFSHKHSSVFAAQGTEPKVFVLFNILQFM